MFRSQLGLHLFADDTQAYVHGPPSAQLQLAGCIDALTRDLDLWMSSNRLSLNSSKTQLIWLGTPQQLQKLDYSLLSDKFPSFVFSSSVRDLGVILDSTLSFTKHISKLTRITINQSINLYSASSRTLLRGAPNPGLVKKKSLKLSRKGTE